MKRLRLLLLPAGAGLVLWLSLTVSAFNSLMLIAMAWLPFSLGFAIQANVLAFSRQRFRWFRFATLGPLLVPIVGAISEMSQKRTFFWELAVFLLVAAAVLYLIGWFAAWALEAKDHA